METISNIPAKKRSKRRTKLYDGARIYHPFLRNNSKVNPFIVKVTTSPNHISPQFWELVNAQGKPASPGAYSERGLHFILRWWGEYYVMSPDEHYSGCITHVAIRDRNAQIWSLPKPNRHSDIIRLIQKLPHAEWLLSRSTQGFLDDSGEFLDRPTAWHAAHRNNQILPPYNPVDPTQRAGKPSDEPGHLFSEDIW